MSIQIKDFGKTTAGQPVKVGILANDTIEVHILSYGATIQQLLVPDRKGNKVDVVLGYPTVQDYELNTCFLGAVVGRYANRIGGSKFTLYEEEYHVTPNEGKNCLHSGLHGFNHTLFDVALTPGETDSVTMTALRKPMWNCWPMVLRMVPTSSVQKRPCAMAPSASMP